MCCAHGVWRWVVSAVVVRIVVEGFGGCYNKSMELFVWWCGCRPVDFDAILLIQHGAKVFWFCGGYLVWFVIVSCFRSSSCLFLTSLHPGSVGIGFFVALH